MECGSLLWPKYSLEKVLPSFCHGFFDSLAQCPQVLGDLLDGRERVCGEK